MYILYKLIASSIFKSLKIKRIYYFSYALCGLYKYYVGADRFEHDDTYIIMFSH